MWPHSTNQFVWVSILSLEQFSVHLFIEWPFLQETFIYNFFEVARDVRSMIH